MLSLSVLVWVDRSGSCVVSCLMSLGLFLTRPLRLYASLSSYLSATPSCLFSIPLPSILTLRRTSLVGIRSTICSSHTLLLCLPSFSTHVSLFVPSFLDESCLLLTLSAEQSCVLELLIRNQTGQR